MSKIIEKIKADKRVQSVSDERSWGDGFWIYLKPGFSNDGGAHCHHEDSPTQAYKVLRNWTFNCDCNDYCNRNMENK